MDKKFVGLFLVALALTTNAMPMANEDWKILEWHDRYLVVGSNRTMFHRHIFIIADSKPDTQPAPAAKWTPLQRAAFKDNVEQIRTLIDNGADVNEQVDDGQTALAVAIMSDHPKCVEALYQRGAHIDLDGIPPLHFAATLGHKNCVEILLKNGANIDEKEITGKTAKDLAQEMGHKDTVELLESYEIQDTKEPEEDTLDVKKPEDELKQNEQ